MTTIRDVREGIQGKQKTILTSVGLNIENLVPLSPNNDWRIAGKLSDVKTLLSDRSEAGATDEVLLRV